MNATDLKKLRTCSARAQKLYDRLCGGAYYQTHQAKTPKAMDELEAAGLVMIAPRQPLYIACFVPKGSRVRLSRETFPPPPPKP